VALAILQKTKVIKFHYLLKCQIKCMSGYIRFFVLPLGNLRFILNKEKKEYNPH